MQNLLSTITIEKVRNFSPEHAHDYNYIIICNNYAHFSLLISFSQNYPNLHYPSYQLISYLNTVMESVTTTYNTHMSNILDLESFKSNPFYSLCMNLHAYNNNEVY